MIGKGAVFSTVGGKDEEFTFRPIEFKMLIRHPTGGTEPKSGCMTGVQSKSPNLTSAQRLKLKSWDRMRSSSE